MTGQSRRDIDAYYADVRAHAKSRLLTSQGQRTLKSSNRKGADMNESEREQILDRRIQARLATDRAYLNAENAEQQSDREAEIELEEDAKLPPVDLWSS